MTVYTPAIDITLRQIFYGQVSELTASYRMEDYPTTAQMADVRDAFMGTFVDALNDLQHSYISNISLKLQNRGDNVNSAVYVVSGAGAITGDDTIVMPPEFNFYIRLGVGETRNYLTGGSVTPREIKRGGWFVFGALDNYLTDGRFSIPATYTSAWSTFRTMATGDMVVAGVGTFIPIVFAEALPSTPRYPYAMAPRIADVESMDCYSITRLKRRKVG